MICDLNVTLEPCPMCASAISISRIRRVYFSAFNEDGNGIESSSVLKTMSHIPEIYGGIMEKEASALLTKFFHNLR